MTTVNATHVTIESKGVEDITFNTIYKTEIPGSIFKDNNSNVYLLVENTAGTERFLVDISTGMEIVEGQKVHGYVFFRVERNERVILERKYMGD